MGSFFQRTLGFIRAIAGQKLHLQFLRAIPLFTFTHDSCVMSTICQDGLLEETWRNMEKSMAGFLFLEKPATELSFSETGRPHHPPSRQRLYVAQHKANPMSSAPPPPPTALPAAPTVMAAMTTATMTAAGAAATTTAAAATTTTVAAVATEAVTAAEGVLVEEGSCRGRVPIKLQKPFGDFIRQQGAVFLTLS